MRPQLKDLQHTMRVSIPSHNLADTSITLSAAFLVFLRLRISSARSTTLLVALLHSNPRRSKRIADMDKEARTGREARQGRVVAHLGCRMSFQVALVGEDMEDES